MSRPALGFEREDALLPGGGVLAGVDEVGRGPWAGPVVACAVVLDRARVPEGLADSKVLTVRRREALAALVERDAAFGLGVASVVEIDAQGLGRATLLAMERALAALPVPFDVALVDGLQLPRLPEGVRGAAQPRADSNCPSVAASILAKVRRDAMMVGLGQRHPPYAWDRNKGYGTKVHAEALARHGVTPHHRTSFAPVAKILERTP